MNRKILSTEELCAASVRLREAGKILVATNGCFDLLHVGHVRYLEAARARGDALAVGVNGDEAVRALKGATRPLNTAHDRAEVLAALECVTFVAIFPETRATQFLEHAQPAVYVKGGDYTPETLDVEERAALVKMGSRIEIIPFQPGYSTTGLLEKIGRP